MNKKIMILSIAIIMLLVSNINVFAEKEDGIEIVYFGTKRCITCHETSQIIKDIIEKYENNLVINIKEYDITNVESEDLFIKYSTNYNVPKESFKVVPALFIGEDFFVGKEPITEGLEEKIIEYINNPEEYKVIELEDKEFNTKNIKFGIVSVMLGGLLDGINPCSISMMLFFISFAIVNKDKGNLLLLGLSFCLGTFVAYYGIGVGLLKFIYAIDSIKYIAIIFYGMLIIMSLYLATLNIIDYFNIKKGNLSNIKNQLSAGSKSRIHNFIKEKVTGKVLYTTAFFSAFIISFLEFFCTGQIYLPMLTYMIRLNVGGVGNYILLALYNFAFILPLLVIAIAIHLGKEIIDVSQILLDKLEWIKLAGFVFFVIVALTMSLQLMKLV